jgi:hypothetical protein
MTRIAITGHRGLPPATAALVAAAIRTELAPYTDDDLVGISCLADGADRLFAQAVLDAGGALEAIVPAEGYRMKVVPESPPAYDSLLARAASVVRLDHARPNSEAYMHASEEMLKRADVVFAVWDGQPPRAWGGTADVVAEARKEGLPVVVIWPPGATRD